MTYYEKGASGRKKRNYPKEDNGKLQLKHKYVLQLKLIYHQSEGKIFRSNCNECNEKNMCIIIVIIIVYNTFQFCTSEA
jgi:hypothetical protein